MSDSQAGGNTNEAQNRVHVRVAAAGDWPSIEPLWQKVFEASDQRSFFTGPAWVGAWLETFGDESHPEILLFETSDGPVAAALLVEQKRTLLRTPLHRLYLHTSGEAPGDSPVAENVSVICRPAERPSVLELFLDGVRHRAWDEFVLNGVTEAAVGELAGGLEDVEQRLEWRPTYLVDLADLRRRAVPYETALTANARAQLRRSMKLYGERGPVTLQPASSTADALATFDHLVRLNWDRHERDGGRGVFTSSRWLSFHRKLITRAFPAGGVQLVTATAGDQTIGILYNLVDRGRVSFYQSALVYEPDNRLKPGQVAHALAIESALAAGFDVYDLLAADGPAGSRYKNSLATRTERLAWGVLRRRTVPGVVVDTLRKARARLR